MVSKEFSIKLKLFQSIMLFEQEDGKRIKIIIIVTTLPLWDLTFIAQHAFISALGIILLTIKRLALSV